VRPRRTFAPARLLALMALGAACSARPLPVCGPDAGGGSPDAVDALADATMPTSDGGSVAESCTPSCAPGIACREGKCQQHRCTGALTFKALPFVSTAGRLYGPALGDFDGDGVVDLAGMPDTDGTMSVLYGAGDGTFPARQVIDAAPIAWQALAGDVDGDGRLDLTSMTSTDAGLLGPLNFTLSVRRGSADRQAPFGQPTIYPTGEGFSAVLLADFDADRRLDLMSAVRAGFEYRRGQADGSFGPAAAVASKDQIFSWVGLPLSTVSPVDWNGDNVIDLVYSAGSGLAGGSLHFRLGRGDGTFGDEVACALAMGVVGDVDGDGRPDLLSWANLLLGLDTCSPRKSVSLPDWPEEARAAFADLDGDGNPDVVIDGNVTVRLGDGKGGFTKTLSLPGVGPAPGPSTLPTGAFLFGDLNRDGKLDVVYTRPDGWGVFLNTCR
jgi:hypothetical protein